MQRPTVLLVEDNPDDEELTLLAINESGIQAEVVVVRDGEEALNYLFSLKDHQLGRSFELPRLVLLDLQLPKIDGHEVLRKIRENPLTKRLPVVIFTSSLEEGDLIRSYDLGVNSYVQKPVESVAFEKAVQDLGLYWMDLNKRPKDQIV